MATVETPTVASPPADRLSDISADLISMTTPTCSSISPSHSSLDKNNSNSNFDVILLHNSDGSSRKINDTLVNNSTMKECNKGNAEMDKKISSLVNISGEAEIVDLERLELGDDESWLFRAPGAENRTDNDNIIKWLKKDYDTLDIRTRKALVTKLEEIVRSSQREKNSVVKNRNINNTDKSIIETPKIGLDKATGKLSIPSAEHLNKTFKIDKTTAHVQQSTSPRLNALSRKLSYDEEQENVENLGQNDPVNQSLVDGRLKKLSLQNKSMVGDNSPDITQIRLLASKQEQDLRNCLQQTQLTHQLRKISSGVTVGHESLSKNPPNLSFTPIGTQKDVRISPPKSSTALKLKPNGTVNVESSNLLVAQQEIGLQKSMPNLLDENFKTPSSLVNSCHINNNNFQDGRYNRTKASPGLSLGVKVRNGSISASTSEKGSYNNLTSTGQPRYPITTSSSSHAVSSSNSGEFKRPIAPPSLLGSRLPTPRSRLPVPGSQRPDSAFKHPLSSAGKLPNNLRQITAGAANFNKTCLNMNDSWKQGCI